MKKFATAPPDRTPHGPWVHGSDPKELAAHHTFVEQLEMSVAIANREVIQKHIPNLTRETFQELAVMVARFRAQYLEAAIRLADSGEFCDACCLADLKHKRDLYDEGCAAFEALERAIERGYVDLDPRS
jgi:hypothetical protein